MQKLFYNYFEQFVLKQHYIFESYITETHVKRGSILFLSFKILQNVADLHSFTNVQRVCDFKGYYVLKV